MSDPLPIFFTHTAAQQKWERFPEHCHHCHEVVPFHQRFAYNLCCCVTETQKAWDDLNVEQE